MYTELPKDTNVTLPAELNDFLLVKHLQSDSTILEWRDWHGESIEVDVVDGRIVLTTHTMLPTGKDWKYQDVQVYREYIEFVKPNVVMTSPQSLLQPTHVPPDKVRETIRFYSKIKAIVAKMEEPMDSDTALIYKACTVMDRLFVCALSGDTEATQAFLESFK